MTIIIRRKGLTAPYWSTVEAAYPAVYATKLPNAVCVDFTMSAKGGGRTQVIVRMKADSFKELASAMVRADHAEAIKALEAALRSAEG